MELEFMELEFQNTTIGSLKRHYKYGAIKLKKKNCMELEFMELEFQNATIGSSKRHNRAKKNLL